MGYIIISEETLKANVSKWNSESYEQKVMADVYNSKVDYSHMLEALQEAEKKIDVDIQKLEVKKNDIKRLIGYVK